MSSAARTRFRDELMADMRWLGLDWDEGPDVGGPSAPYSQAERGEFYRGLVRALGGGGHGLSLLLHGRGAGAVAKTAAHGGQTAALCRHLPASDGRAARRAGGAGPEADAAICRARRPDDRIHRCRARAATLREQTTSATSSFAARTARRHFSFATPSTIPLMGVTQVLRGDDHLTNTPRQFMLLDALGMRQSGLRACGAAGGRGRRTACRNGTAAPACRNFASADSCAPPCSIICSAWGMPAMSTAGCPPRRCRRISGREHLGRAPARFEESQLMHWQKESLQRMSAAEFGAWLGADDSAGVRRSGAPQRGAAGGCRSLARGGARRACRRSAPRSSASSPPRARIFSPPPPTPTINRTATSSTHAAVEGAHRAQGAGPVHAAAGGA